MNKILCVCLGNQSRSPMMAAVLQNLVREQFEVESAGVREAAAGMPANPLSVECMSDRGIDLSGHVSRWVGHLELDSYSAIICVGESEAEILRRHAPHLRILVANNGLGIDDPSGGGIEAYRACLETIDVAMTDFARAVSPGRPTGE